MPAPSTPTSFAADSIAMPLTAVVEGSLGNYGAVKLTWTSASLWHRLQMQVFGEWKEINRSYPTAETQFVEVRSLTSNSAEIFGLRGTSASFRIAAIDNGGQSAYTATVVATFGTGAIVLADLLAPVATLITNSATLLRLDWTDAQARESHFELELRDAATGLARTYGLPTFARNFSRALGVEGVNPLTTYTARVRAVSQQRATRLDGPWSNELFFTTLAPNIVLTKLPATVDWWRNAPSASYNIVTNTAPTSTSTGSLPTGLTHSSGVISGVPIASVNTYAVNITASNAGSTDTKVLTINVREPALTLQFAKSPTGTFADGNTASSAGVGIGALGVVLNVRLRAVALGPISTTLSSITLVGAPEWLTVVSGALQGTPTVSGDWYVQVTATNGIHTCVDVLRVTVADVSITSADSLTVYDQQPISFPVTTAPTTAHVTASGLPSWLSLDSGTLAGTAPESGDVQLVLTAALGSSTALQPFTLRVLPVLTGPAAGADGIAEITGWVGDPLIEAIYYFGTCDIEQWYLSNQPPGVEVGALTCPGPYAENKAVAIVGAPTAYGIFDAVVTAQCCCDGAPKLYRLPVRFNISGGLFFHWFHGDPFRRELQVLLRTGEVRSLYETATEVLSLKRGDNAKVHILFRDGPFGDSRLSREIITEGFDELRLVIRPAGDFDGEPYFDLGGALVTEGIDGKTVAYFEFEVSGDAVERAFDELNKSRGATPSALALTASGELTWKRSGHPDTSKRFAVRISQDIER